MYSCSNGINNVVLVLLMCFSKIMVSLIGPYSCLLFKMCDVYADWGVVVFYVSDMFLISLLKSTTSLSDV